MKLLGPGIFLLCFIFPCLGQGSESSDFSLLGKCLAKEDAIELWAPELPHSSQTSAGLLVVIFPHPASGKPTSITEDVFLKTQKNSIEVEFKKRSILGSAFPNKIEFSKTGTTRLKSKNGQVFVCELI